jgi:hypothetical protein
MIWDDWAVYNVLSTSNCSEHRIEIAFASIFELEPTPYMKHPLTQIFVQPADQKFGSTSFSIKHGFRGIDSSIL